MSKIKNFFSDHSGQILGAGTIASFGIALWRMYVSSPRIHEIIDYAKEDWSEAQTKEERKRIMKGTIRDIFAEAWPIMASSIAGTGMEIANVHQANAKIDEYAFLYTATKEFSDRYRKATKEEVGEKTEREIHERAAKGYIVDNPPPSVNIVDGDWVIFDTVSKQYIVNNASKVQTELNRVYDRCRSGNWTDYAGFLLSIGGDISQLPDDICMRGWDIDDGVIEPIWVADFDKNNRPIAVLSYSVMPKRQKNHLHE